jgi:hypothetical protein
MHACLRPNWLVPVALLALLLTTTALWADDAAPNPPEKEALLIVWDPNDLAWMEDALIRHMAGAHSLNIEIRQAGAAGFADITGKDIVLISSSVDSSDVGTAFRDVAIPVLTWEPGVLDAMMMINSAADQGWIGDCVTPADTVDMDTDPVPLSTDSDDHILFGSFSGQGTQVVYEPDGIGCRKIGWGRPAGSPIRVNHANAANPDKVTTFAYKPGDAMAAGFIAPAKRVFTFAYSITPDHPGEESSELAVDEVGLELFEMALEWALLP